MHTGLMSIPAAEPTAFDHAWNHKGDQRRLCLEKPTRELGTIIGDSPSLNTALDLLSVVAPTDSNVLILGETGTGKELFARAIHNLSSRRDRAFVRVNCAAIPTGLL